MYKTTELIGAAAAKSAGGNERASATGISTDSRLIRPGEAFIALRGDNFDGHDFIKDVIDKGASIVIAETIPKGLTKRGPAFLQVRDTTRALGDIARARRKKFSGVVIAITGSNGKTTTKEMLAHVLSARYKVLKNEGTKNNHIGLPQTLLKLDDAYDCCVLEAGTNHFGEIEYLASICRPNICAITNIGHSHLEFLRDLSGVLREKSSLLRYLEAPFISLLNADDAMLEKIISSQKKRPLTFSFGVRNKCDFKGRFFGPQGGGLEFAVNGRNGFCLNTLGRHNVYNALIAVAAARLLGLDYGTIARRLATFKFPRSRLNLIELNRVKFINDTYNSNPVSFAMALEALRNFDSKGRKVLVMGDMLELGGRSEDFHRQAGRLAASSCDVFVAVGKLSHFAAEEAKALGFDSGRIYFCSSNLEARKALFEKIAPSADDVVLVKGSRSMKLEEILT
ncbi:MAG: UDP-N-acetylmuramoyl-tripeptide--D-alanyl-D-alanine ligase [Candidatus Omnitrophica bacterium]|nr:UDP-N-acetylmuramoyl-tripeptide--D-alanyl-D-alanine ligase [Candidatus Omnitrophota bacterium]